MKISYSGVLAVVAGAMLLPSFSALAGPDDSRIEASAKNSYAFKTYLSNDHIRVKARDGAVTLTGSVADDSQKALAENTVASLPGVVSVNNELKIKGESTHSDSWLAVKVKSALLFHKNVSSADTKVVAQNGVVTLTGTARSQAQKDLTAEYAKDVDGVVSVNNMITVSPTVVESAGAQNNVVVQNNPSVDRDRETFRGKVDDASISAQVKGALLSHRSTSAINTKVKTMDGNVVITGVARDAAEKDLVTKLASDINGVRNVDNQMTVASPNSQ